MCSGMHQSFHTDFYISFDIINSAHSSRALGSNLMSLAHAQSNTFAVNNLICSCCWRLWQKASKCYWYMCLSVLLWKSNINYLVIPLSVAFVLFSWNRILLSGVATELFVVSCDESYWLLCKYLHANMGRHGKKYKKACQTFNHLITKFIYRRWNHKWLLVLIC